ncbi:uncharacterized protein LOC110835380 isoform X2 [Zootermopsis nevadensis]|nr:uncharacterized protein LOC110835380 isoform X2 [Zootermopsis nevadensis]XP_021931230.1 uncharacterized protein LOC110835380 isoform X2 [Zootermopsis nevadensis]
MANKEYHSCCSQMLPLTGFTDDIPTFNVQDIFTETGNFGNDNDLPDEDDNDRQWNSSSVDLTQDCPIVHLPVLLLSKISMKCSEKYGVVQSYKGKKVYGKLPPDIREAVMKTNQKKSSIQDFFKNSQWTMYLHSKRSTVVNKTQD